MITVEQLVKIAPTTRKKAPLYIDWLNKTMEEFDIDTVVRQASFIAQLLHESGCLNYVCEIASGAAYELRASLGNDKPGDGKLYRGHGLIQITGKTNHFAVADYFEIDRDIVVAWLQTPEGACRSAGYFWDTHKLNVLADKGDNVGITRRINGGALGLANRLALFAAAKNVLKGTQNA